MISEGRDSLGMLIELLKNKTCGMEKMANNVNG